MDKKDNINYKEKFEKLKEEYETILDSIDDGIFVIDPSGHIMKVNKAVEKSGGRSKAELQGRSIYELVEEGYCDRFVSETVIEKKEKITIVQNVDGEKEVLVTGIPCFKDNQLNMVVACERDISELVELREKLTEAKKLNIEYEKEIEKLKTSENKPDYLVYQSDGIEKIIGTLKRAANVDTTVLLYGESGVGKEVFAKYIHESGSRGKEPFIRINCGAISENLIESELFGYVEGAFTGAVKKGKKGFFELANGGTIFLDEISELPINLQSKLLRVIQEKEITPVGGTGSIKLDLKIIVATNKKLKDLVDEGKFREDLYYRFAVMQIEIPPLRERKEDIIPLSLYFLEKLNKKFHMKKNFSLEVLSHFKNNDWPGNVRQLENYIEQLMIVSEEDHITMKSLSELEEGDKKVTLLRKGGKGLAEQVEALEYEILLEAFTQCKDTREMAERLGTTRSTINRKLAKYSIRSEQEK